MRLESDKFYRAPEVSLILESQSQMIYDLQSCDMR